MFGDTVDTESKPGAARIPTTSPNIANAVSRVSGLLPRWLRLPESAKSGKDAFTAGRNHAVPETVFHPSRERDHERQDDQSYCIGSCRIHSTGERSC